MTVREYLLKPHRLRIVIKAKEIRLDKLRDLSASISGCSFEEHFSGTRNTDPPFVRHLGEITQLEHEIKEDREQLTQLENEIREATEILTDQRERLILRSLFLCGLSLEQTAVLLNCTVRQAKNLYRKAIRDFEALFMVLPDEGGDAR